MDVTDETSVDLALKSIGEATPIQLLVNNAGVRIPGTLQSATKEDMMRHIEVNAIGPWLVTRAFTGNLVCASSAMEPSIVAQVSSRIGSIGATVPGGWPGDYAYSTSKAALNRFTKSLANDLKGKGIITLALGPGYVRTAITGNNGVLSTDKSVAMLKPLLDEATVADNGSFLHIDGSIYPW